MTEVYSAGSGVSAAFMMSRASVVWLRVNSDAADPQLASAVPATAWIAGKSLARMRMDWPSGPQAIAEVPIRAVIAPATANALSFI